MRGRSRHIRPMAKVALTLLFLLTAVAVPAAELVVLESPSCAWCLKWQRDIGRSYEATRAARLMPLRRVDVTRPVPPEIAALTIAAVPTFVVTGCGREVGRITGYSTQVEFWKGLEGIAGRLEGGC